MTKSQQRFCSDAEAASFRELQQRLPQVWEMIRDPQAPEHTSVILPSMSLDQEELAKIQGSPFYEERLLFTLIRLRHPRARVLYLTSQPIHPEILDYYLHLLVGVPASHARRRLNVMCVYDATSRSLTEKVLERPGVLERIRKWVGDRQCAYLTCFNSTHRERRLALALGIPLNGVDPELLWLGTKSGSREIFRRAGVELPRGCENLSTEGELLEALSELERQRPGLKRAVIKLNDGFSGEGNAVFHYPAGLRRRGQARSRALQEALQHLRWPGSPQSLQRYLTKLQQMHGVVEEFLEASQVRSPSVQLRVNPDGALEILSTHDQVLGGPTGQVYLGCHFPAGEEYRRQLLEQAWSIGQVLRDQGVIGRFGIDFLVTRQAGGPWNSHAIEINLRMGGTTHPFLALEFLTGGKLDPRTGLFHSPRGLTKYYFATDNLKSPHYRKLVPEDFVDLLAVWGLQFNPNTETGVLFHMIGALSQYGKLGMTCIGNSREEVEDFHRRTVAILDRATGADGSSSGSYQPLFDETVPQLA